MPTWHYESKIDGSRCFKDYDNLKLVKSFQSPEFNIVCSKRKRAVDVTPKPLDVDSSSLLFERKRSAEGSELMLAVEQPFKRMSSYPPLTHYATYRRPNVHHFYATYGDLTPSALLPHSQIVDANSLLLSPVCNQSAESDLATSTAKLDSADSSLSKEAKVKSLQADNSKKPIENSGASKLDILLRAMELMHEEGPSGANAAASTTRGVKGEGAGEREGGGEGEGGAQAASAYLSGSSGGVAYTPLVSDMHSSYPFGPSPYISNQACVHFPFRQGQGGQGQDRQGRGQGVFLQPNDSHRFAASTCHGYHSDSPYQRYAEVAMNQGLFRYLQSGTVKQKYETMA